MVQRNNVAIRNGSGSSVGRASLGVGQSYETVDYNGGTSALTGNPFGTSVIEYGVDLNGGFGPQVIVKQGVPETIAFDLMYDLTALNFVTKFYGDFNPENKTTPDVTPNIVIDYNVTGALNARDRWDICDMLLQCVPSGVAIDNPAVDPKENANMAFRETISMTASQWIRLKRTKLAKLADAELSTLNDLPARVVLEDVDNNVWAFIDGDATPTSAQLARYNAKTGELKALVSITPMTNLAVTQAVIAGGYLAVADGSDVHYTNIQEQLKGNNVWGTATSSGTFSPHSLGVASNGRIWAGSTGGVIYQSVGKDPFSFEIYDNAVATTEQINSIVFPSPDFGWFGCASGELVLYENGTLTNVTVPAGLTDDITKVQVPPLNADVLIIGTDAGTVWSSINAQSVDREFTLKTMPVSGGAVADIQFSNTFNGLPMLVLWNPASGAAKIIHDRSGGGLGNDAFTLDEIGTANVGCNSLCIVNANLAIIGGDAVGSKAYIGKIS